MMRDRSRKEAEDKVGPRRGTVRLVARRVTTSRRAALGAVTAEETGWASVTFGRARETSLGVTGLVGISMASSKSAGNAQDE